MMKMGRNMLDVRFYHLQSQRLEQVLPSLLTKALNGGHHIVVKLADLKQLKALNEYLWCYRDDSFLPHGTADDGPAQGQPIYLTLEDENPNGASVLILIEGCESTIMDDFDLCCVMLNGRDDLQVKEARRRWKLYGDAGYNTTYWQQSNTGGWQQK